MRFSLDWLRNVFFTFLRFLSDFWTKLVSLSMNCSEDDDELTERISALLMSKCVSCAFICFSLSIAFLISTSSFAYDSVLFFICTFSSYNSYSFDLNNVIIFLFFFSIFWTLFSKLRIVSRYASAFCVSFSINCFWNDIFLFQSASTFFNLFS